MNPYRSQTDIASFIAKQAHSGQFRRDGKTPYHTHPEAVAEALARNGECDNVVAAGWLHDVLEDCPEWDVSRLRMEGINQAVLEAVYRLTKPRGLLGSTGDRYMDYIRLVAVNPIARKVKIQDILHNLQSTPRPEHVSKYAHALGVLIQ